MYQNTSFECNYTFLRRIASVRPKVFINSTQNMCKSIWCEYEQSLKQEGVGHLLS